MERILYIVGFVILILLIVNLSKMGRTGRDKWLKRRRTGESMLDDFDEEWKNIDKLSK